MIGPGTDRRIMVAVKPIDFRAGINSLTALVATSLEGDPYLGDVWIFRSKRLDRLKLLVWDGTGMILATKWLESGSFKWPPVRDGTIVLGVAQMALLMEGLEWSRSTPVTVKRPTLVG
jgi:transposase